MKSMSMKYAALTLYFQFMQSTICSGKSWGPVSVQDTQPQYWQKYFIEVDSVPAAVLTV